jgi:adenylylsulfate kinase
MSAGAVVWFTGLPAAGKSTLAARLAARLVEAGVPTATLDSDQVREALVPSPGHDGVARDGFYRTLAGLAALLARQGLVTLVAATAHRRVWRDVARAMAPRFVEVFVDTPLAECQRRDPKGLYAAASALPHLPGVHLPYEPPAAPDVVARPGHEAAALDELATLLGVGG